MALFYHSSTSPTGIVGVARVKSEPYADLTAFDPRHEHFDPRSALLQKKYIAEHVARTTRKVTDAAHSSFVPTWMLVDFSFVKKFSQIITLAEIKSDPKLDGMVVRQKGSRLSIQPVSEKEFCYITEVMARKR